MFGYGPVAALVEQECRLVLEQEVMGLRIQVRIEG